MLNPGTDALKFALITAPATEPVTLVDMKEHLRVGFDIDNGLIELLITTARQHIEEVTGRALVTQTFDLFLDRFPSEIHQLRLPRAPIASVVGVFYTLDSTVEATIAPADYVVDQHAEPGRILLRSGKTWPTGELEPANGVRVRFIAGYGAAAVVPMPLRHAIKLLVAHFYEHREEVARLMGGRGGQFAVLPFGVKSLISPFVIPRYD